MAYLEIKKGEGPVKRRHVEDQVAEKGIRFQLGSVGQVNLGPGETKTVGPYTVRLVLGEAVLDENDASSDTNESPAAGVLDALQFYDGFFCRAAENCSSQDSWRPRRKQEF